VSYSLDGAAVAMGQSRKTIDRAIKAGDLTPRYVNSKAVILHSDLVAWIETAPVDKPGTTP